MYLIVIASNIYVKYREFKTFTKETDFKHRRKFMIIAIGGGEVSQNQTYDIDKFIVESSKKKIQIFYSFRQQVKMLRLM